jgi:hypothetical protein
MDPVRFDAPWDATLKVLTLGVVLVILLAVGLVVHAAVRLAAHHGSVALGVVVGSTSVVPILVAWAARELAPRSFSVGGDGVHVERRAGLVRIPIATIRTVRELGTGARFTRVGGVGGLFGYWGEYRNAELGRVKLYATRSDGRVLLGTDTATYVVTPGSPARFVEEIERRLGRPPP